MKPKRPPSLLLDTDRNVGFNKKYTTIAIYAVLVILFAALLIYFLLSPERLDALFGALESIVSPILIGLILAYLIYPIFRFFEKKVFISRAERHKQQCRRILYKAKLRYDFECRAHPNDPSAAEESAKALADAQNALDDANKAAALEWQKKEAAARARFAKQSRPSFVRQSPPAPARVGKALSLTVTYLLVLTAITIFVWIILPPCIESIGDLLILCRSFITTLPKRFTSFELGRQIRDLLRQFELADDVKNWVMGISSELITRMTTLVTKLPALLTGLISNLTDLLLGIFLSVYILSSREMLFGQLKKLSRALLPARAYAGGRHILHEIDRKFGKYIQGKLISSAILGLASCILFGAVGIPYFQMITLIVTVTNLIPFFGPFIGAIPSALIILIADPDKLIIFIILVIVLQQIEGNILEPYILGDSLGLEPVWIMVAIVVMGELFGILGMVLGVPLFAVLYTLIGELCDKRLKKKK